MFEKFSKIFGEKDKKRKTENLIAFLIILVITLVIINRIIPKDKNDRDYSNETGVQLVTEPQSDEVEINSNNLKNELEDILSKMNGVGKVEVLLTYSESSSISPLYNESTSSSTSTASDGTTTETKTENKEIFTNSTDEAVIEKYVMPKLEGAVVIAEGARKY